MFKDILVSTLCIWNRISMECLNFCQLYMAFNLYRYSRKSAKITNSNVYNDLSSLSWLDFLGFKWGDWSNISPILTNPRFRLSPQVNHN